jgi:hypothetical protein
MESDFRNWSFALLVVALGCGKGNKSSPHDMTPPDMAHDTAPPDLAMTPTPLGVGHIAYKLLDDHHVYRVAATDPPAIEDVTAELDAVSPGTDSTISLSHDGKLAGIVTQRFGCAGYDCLALAPVADTVMAAAATVPTAAGQQLHPDDRPALANGGAFIVYSASGGPHGRDLFIVRNNGAGDYSAPLLLTGASTFDFNLLPALTRDESSVVYDCSATGSKVMASLCRVGLDGSGWAVALAGSGGPGATSMNEVHSGDFLPDNSTLVFEADWSAGNQRIWKRDAAGTLSQFNPMFTNDVTPCVLPDGRVASLWLNRPDNLTGSHELKVMSPDGQTYQMLVINADIIDVGISCSN